MDFINALNSVKPYRLALRLLSVAALTLVALAPASAQRYTVTDLGKDNMPRTLNSSGQVIGYHKASTSTNPDYGFLWTPTTPSATAGTLTTLLTGIIYPRAINASGQVVGRQVVQDSSGAYHDHPFVWTPDTANATTGSSVDPNNLLAPTSGWNLTEAYCLNDAGVMFGTGTYTDASGVAATKGYLWQKDTAGNLALTPLTLYSDSISLNNLVSPQLAGYSWLWQNGVRTMIAQSGPALQSYSLNDVGQVAGTLSTATGLHASVWTPDAPNGTTSAVGAVDLHLAGYWRSYARCLNNAGQVVGSAQLTQNYYNAQASLWDGSGWHDLNTICNSLPAGWKLLDAYGVNNRTVSVNGTLTPSAQITGIAVVTITTTTIVHNKPVTTTTSNYHGFLLTPQ